MALLVLVQFPEGILDRIIPGSYSRSTNQTSAEPKTYYKAVCLLPSPTWNTVPRGKVKVDLIDKNLCVDAWAVDKSWSEEDLKFEAAKLFPKLLGSDSPEPIP